MFLLIKFLPSHKLSTQSEHSEFDFRQPHPHKETPSSSITTVCLCFKTTGAAQHDELGFFDRSGCAREFASSTFNICVLHPSHLHPLPHLQIDMELQQFPFLLAEEQLLNE